MVQSIITSSSLGVMALVLIVLLSIAIKQLGLFETFVGFLVKAVEKEASQEKAVSCKRQYNDFTSFIGKELTLFCANYIYTGEVVEATDYHVKLKNAKIVYETGGLSDQDWKYTDSFPNPVCVRLSFVESYSTF